MAIYVYNGKQSRFSLTLAGETYQFDWGVPTFVKNSTVPELMHISDFEEYNPQKEYVGLPRKILVSMPVTLEWFIPALAILKRIQGYYPYCQIEVECQAQFNDLVNIGNPTQYVDRNNIINYYRIIDLNVNHYSETERRLSHYLMFSYEQMLLRMTRLIDEIDLKQAPIPLDGWNSNSNDITIVETGIDAHNTFQGLADAIITKMKPANIIKADMGNEDWKDILSKFQNSKYIILCGDSILSLLACYSGAPCFIFMASDARQRESQYKRFTNVKYSYIDLGKPLEIIVDKLNNIVQGINTIPITSTKVMPNVQPQPMDAKSQTRIRDSRRAIVNPEPITESEPS